mmetsp:Transcript_125470/g.360622  ORF Transcript_125470/g.360622 Transcript_125470/m.360622 type:complete len:265 (-) Transcript_125470:210-1004(-)
MRVLAPRPRGHRGENDAGGHQQHLRPCRLSCRGLHGADPGPSEARELDAPEEDLHGEGHQGEAGPDRHVQRHREQGQAQVVQADVRGERHGEHEHGAVRSPTADGLRDVAPSRRPHGGDRQGKGDEGLHLLDRRDEEGRGHALQPDLLRDLGVGQQKLHVQAEACIDAEVQENEPRNAADVAVPHSRDRQGSADRDRGEYDNDLRMLGLQRRPASVPAPAWRLTACRRVVQIHTVGADGSDVELLRPRRLSRQRQGRRSVGRDI